MSECERPRTARSPHFVTCYNQNTAMKITVDVQLPDTLTFEEELQIIGDHDPAGRPCITYEKPIDFRRITIRASRPLKKVMGFRPATTLHIAWDDSVTRAEARSDFLEYLTFKGVDEDLRKRCAHLFDNAVAVDEEGTWT